MRLSRSLIEHELTIGARLRLPERSARHFRQVLRLRPGAEVILFNGRDGRDYRARLTRVDKQAVEADIISAGEPEPPAPLHIHLLLGISRGERMDFALQKSVELGVGQITPLFSERTQVKLQGARLARRQAHWQGVLNSACEQSGRCWPARLHPPQHLTQILPSVPDAWLLDPEATTSLPQMQPPASGAVHLLIGPEGGFSEQEHELVYAQGCTGVRLGPRILRTETAPLAAISAIQVLWGDFRPVTPN